MAGLMQLDEEVRFMRDLCFALVALAVAALALVRWLEP